MIGSVTNKTFTLKQYALLITLFSSPNYLHANDIDKSGIDVVKELSKCRKMIENNTRLNCFDRVAKKFSPPLYTGRESKISDVIKIDRPHRLRFRSYGAIFVLYLRDLEGNVLQNLHIGGTGEDTYLIEEPGEYTLKMLGSDRWEIWLEPEDTVAESK